MGQTDYIIQAALHPTIDWHRLAKSQVSTLELTYLMPDLTRNIANLWLSLPAPNHSY
jgi:hypothetical protein